MSTSYNFADAQQLLIKPFERLKWGSCLWRNYRD